MNVCQLTELKQTRAVRDGKNSSSAKMILTPLWDIPALRYSRRLRIASRRSLAFHLKNNSKAHILIMYTDVSIIKDQSAILLNLRCECDHHPQRQCLQYLSLQFDSGVEAVMHSLHWIALRDDSQAIQLPSSSQIQWTCFKTWHVCHPSPIGCTVLDRLSRQDRLAGKATITSGLWLVRFDMLRSLRNYLEAYSQGHLTTDHLEVHSLGRHTTDHLEAHCQGHHTFDHLEERGAEEEVLDNQCWQDKSHCHSDQQLSN